MKKKRLVLAIRPTDPILLKWLNKPRKKKSSPFICDELMLSPNFKAWRAK